MADHPIIEYIRDARGKGLPSATIVDELVQAGWHVHDIVDVVLDHIEPKPKTETPIREEGGIISVRNVSKAYGNVKALDNISLTVQPGAVTALLGPNGAGKTTLVRILATLLTKDKGRVTVAGFDVSRDAARLRSVIGLAGQYAAVDETLTGRENLEMVGRLYRMSTSASRARATELLKQFGLLDAADRAAKTYSGGMRRRLDLAASLVAKPRILFLDEPTTGLDPQSRFTLWHVIRDLVAGGTTVLLTTQYLEEADQLAHHIFVIDHGRIIASGSPDELKRQIGVSVLEIHLADPLNVSRVIDIIKQFGSETPHADTDTGIVTMPVSGGATILVDVVRQLDAATIELRDVMLRRPSLDDVFLKLTGHAAE